MTDILDYGKKDVLNFIQSIIKTITMSKKI